MLEGPNLYFPRPAVKVTLALPGYLDAPDEALRASRPRAGLRRGQPGAPGSEQRQQVLLRLVERRPARWRPRSGTRRLGVRTRAANETDVVVCAFVWRHRARARGAGRGDRRWCSATCSPAAPSRMPWPTAAAGVAAAIRAGRRAPGWSRRASRSPR